MFDEFVMNDKHTINSMSNKKSIYIFIHTFIEKWLTILKIYLIKYLNNDFIKSFVFFIFVIEIKHENMLYKYWNDFIKFFNFVISFKNINLSFDQKSFDENVILTFDCSTTILRLFESQKCNIYTTNFV